MDIFLIFLIFLAAGAGWIYYFKYFPTKTRGTAYFNNNTLYFSEPFEKLGKEISVTVHDIENVDVKYTNPSSVPLWLILKLKDGSETKIRISVKYGSFPNNQYNQYVVYGINYEELKKLIENLPSERVSETLKRIVGKRKFSSRELNSVHPIGNFLSSDIEIL